MANEQSGSFLKILFNYAVKVNDMENEGFKSEKDITEKVEICHGVKRIFVQYTRRTYNINQICLHNALNYFNNIIIIKSF